MRRHFAQFDDELQDSDQTIARHLQPRARLPTLADASDRSSSNGRAHPARRRFPASAFFSDTTDDDMSRPIARPSGRSQLSMSACSRSNQQTTSRAPLHMSAGPSGGRCRSERAAPTLRVHVDAIQFPATRSVLWDRRQLSAEPIGVSLGQVLPQFIVSAEALKEIYRLYGENSGARGNGVALCYLYGDAKTPRVKKVLLEGVKMTKEDARAAGAWCIPVHRVAGGNDPGVSQESYAATIAAVQSSYRDEYTDNVASKLQPKLLVFRSSPHEAQLDFQLECAASPVLFKFSLVRNLPLLMTPLAASLARREFSTRSGNLRSGYLTLDRTRKAVPLLKVDPLVLQQPVVGVWVYGVQIDDAWDEETVRRQLADPFLYFACIGYLMSEAIKERVGPARNTFLVAMYPGGDPEDGETVGSLPRFFECSYSDFLTVPARPLPMELYSHRRSCLVGVSKFSTDVELTLSAAPTSEWEAARRQAKIPTAPRLTEAHDSESSEVNAVPDNNSREQSYTAQAMISASEKEEDEDSTNGWTVTADVFRRYAAPATNICSRTSVRSENAEDITSFDEASLDEVGKKFANASSEPDLHDATCTQAAKESSHLSALNDMEDITRSRQRGWSGNNDSSYRSCCKTQQLLTIQHQQILENQQRQLHEMQEQITQLRRLLDEARGNNQKEANHVSNDAGYDSDASSLSSDAVADVSNLSGTFSRHENGHRNSQSSIVSVPRQMGDDSFSDKPSIHAHQQNENEENNEDMDKDKDVSLSSLDLSSISSGSVDANLSSLSSSLAGERLKELDSSSSISKLQARDDFADLQAEALQRSKISTGSTRSAFQRENYADAEATVDQGRGKIEENTAAQNLAISELSSSMNGEAARDGHKSSVVSAGSHEDDEDRDADVSGNNRSVFERLLPPDVYLRKVGGFVDHHGGCFTTPPLDFHSFCVPRIKFSSEAPECSLSDSEDEEIRLIEQKYKRLMAA
ncbi:hypothetical protein PR003_g625 [Phytophthora rubi]|uniref:STIL N-terminal domain-containing protein n=1 Tax=Phytophthora rubi TaxID=129364 RepID=A0A6A3P7M0_9STRA|nr:hypothetical protein PR001_g1237 [Phytophthora rubi]KAE9359635.1 hypothetical protein PR003_g625 [Phytophthora rubi]